MGFLTTKLLEGVANAFRLFLASFCYFVKKSIFHLNWNDDLKESGVGVGSYGNPRSRSQGNPRSRSWHPRNTRSRSRTLYLPTPQP